MNLANMQAANNLAALYQQGPQQSLNQYDPNPQLTKAVNRLAAAIEALKPRVRVPMGRSIA